MLNKQKTSWQLKRGRSLSAALLVLLFLLSWSIYKEIKSQQQIRGDIKKLNDEYSRLEDQSLKLVRRLKYLQSDEFVEYEAREKLNMAKEGEHVVLITRKEADNLASKDTEKNLKNWQLWIKYFFEKRN